MRVARILAPAAVAVVVTAAVAPAVAATQPHYPPTATPTTHVLHEQVTRVPTPESTKLAATGDPIALYTVTGAALLLAGGVVTAVVRRRAAPRMPRPTE